MVYNFTFQATGDFLTAVKKICDKLDIKPDRFYYRQYGLDSGDTSEPEPLSLKFCDNNITEINELFDGFVYGYQIIFDAKQFNINVRGRVYTANERYIEITGNDQIVIRIKELLET